MTRQDYQLAKKNAARQIIAIVEIKKSVQKVIDNLNPENFQTIESFYYYLQSQVDRIQSLDITLTRLISNVRFYQKCIKHRLSDVDDTDFEAIDCY